GVVLVELRSCPRHRAERLSAALRRRALPARVSGQGRRVACQLAGRRRCRTSSRSASRAGACQRRVDRAMDGAAMNRYLPSPARGAAIVLAMLLAALAATIATTLLWQQQRWINDHEHRRDQVQAQALAMAGVQWARQIVNDNAPANAPVHLGQPWALRLPAIPLENGSIAGYIVDGQSRINVNNLGNTASQAGTLAAMTRLFATLSVPPALLNAVTDWVDADDRVTDPGGAEDAWYMAQTTPSLSANAPVKRTGELLAVRG